MLSWFTLYARRYVARHFHSLLISKKGLPNRFPEFPLVIYLNHASWWDPLTCLLLKNAFFPARTAFAPIEAVMLERYRFFRKLGFFGIERGTRRGAANFLRSSEAILASANNILFVTPQGRFADVRQRPARLAKGIGHLAARGTRAIFVPLAVEYVFWEERLPEIIVRFGEPAGAPLEGNDPNNASDWNRVLELRLAETQDALASETQLRDRSAFRALLHGSAGVSKTYDVWRACSAKVRGQFVTREHYSA